jgi:hypothetical protein
MAVTTTNKYASNPVSTVTANNKGVTFVNADSTTLKDIFVAGTNGSVVKNIAACTNDTSTNNVQLYFHDGSTAYLIGTIAVATLSGTNGTAASINLLTSGLLPITKYDNAGNKVIALESGQKIQAGVIAAVTSAKTLTITSFGEDY